MRNLIIVAVMVFFSACGRSAYLVSKRGFSESSYAPTNEKATKGGTVKYLAQGNEGGIRTRREEAYKKMSEICNGPYKIVSETTKNDGGTAIAIGGGNSVYGGDNWAYIDFACEN